MSKFFVIQNIQSKAILSDYRYSLGEELLAKWDGSLKNNELHGAMIFATKKDANDAKKRLEKVDIVSEVLPIEMKVSYTLC